MSSPRKLAINKTVLFVTTSVEQGLLFVANEVIETILYSCMARAQALHPVPICHFLFESTHAHFIMAVDKPEDIKGFMGRFKTEAAHALNRLLGRKKRTIWCEGYDSPVVLTPQDVIEKIKYTYTNPAKDGLNDCIEEYPNVSSWQMYRTNQLERECHWVHRPTIPKLAKRKLSPDEAHRLAKTLKNASPELHTLTISPNYWMECFGITEPKEQQQLNEQIVAYVAESEAEFKAERDKQHRPAMGRHRLMHQAIDTDYTPDRHGRKMWCICSDIPFRIVFISMVKELIAQAVEALARWRIGDLVPFPPGLYPPSLPRLAEPLRSSVLGW